MHEDIYWGSIFQGNHMHMWKKTTWNQLYMQVDQNNNNNKEEDEQIDGLDLEPLIRMFICFVTLPWYKDLNDKDLNDIKI